MIVCCVFVLANASLNQWRTFHSRKAVGHVVTQPLETLLAHGSFAQSRIELRTARIIGNFEFTSVGGRNAVDKTMAVISPHRQLACGETIVSRRRAKEKHILPGGENAVADGLGKKFSQPRTTGEDILIRCEFRTVRKLQAQTGL